MATFPELEEKVLHVMRRRQQLGLSPAKASYLAAIMEEHVEQVRAALFTLKAEGLVGSTTANSFTPSWFLTTAAQEG